MKVAHFFFLALTVLVILLPILGLHYLSYLGCCCVIIPLELTWNAPSATSAPTLQWRRILFLLLDLCLQTTLHLSVQTLVWFSALLTQLPLAELLFFASTHLLIFITSHFSSVWLLPLLLSKCLVISLQFSTCLQGEIKFQANWNYLR